MKESLFAHRLIELKAKAALVSRDPAALRRTMQEIAVIAEKESKRLKAEDTLAEVVKK